MTKKPTIDPVFAEYTRTAPLGDLTFYVRCAERQLMTLELSERTVNIAREMVALEHALTVSNSAGTPAANKTRVWTLISQYRSSIPGWAGNAGAKGSWVEPLESDSAYWSARDALVTVKTKHRDRSKAEGPVTLEQIAAWHAPALERSARLNGYGVPQRVEPLSPDAVRALLTEGLPERPVAALATKPQRARLVSKRAPQPSQPPTPVGPALICPACAASLRPICGHTLQCERCHETFHVTLYARHRRGTCRACAKAA